MQIIELRMRLNIQFECHAYVTKIQWDERCFLFHFRWKCTVRRTQRLTGFIHTWMNGLFHCWQLRANERVFQLNVCKALVTHVSSQFMSRHCEQHNIISDTLAFNKNWFKIIITFRYAFRLALIISNGRIKAFRIENFPENWFYFY